MNDAERLLDSSNPDRFNFDPERLSSPTYLSTARWLASEVFHKLYEDFYLLEETEAFKRAITGNTLEGDEIITKSVLDFLEWNKNQDPNGVGILWPDDLNQMMVYPPHALKLPKPNIDKSKITSAKFGDWAITYNISMFNTLKDKIPTGFVSGVFDVLHGGHVRFLYECAKYLNMKSVESGKGGMYNLTVAVDLDELTASMKGSTRPLLNFNQRVSAISELPFVTFTTYHDAKNVSFPLHHKNSTYIYEFFPYLYGEIVEDTWKAYSHPGDERLWGNIFETMYHFYAEEDAIANSKKTWAEKAQIKPVAFPQWVTVHTTNLEQHFRLKKES